MRRHINMQSDDYNYGRMYTRNQDNFYSDEEDVPEVVVLKRFNIKYFDQKQELFITEVSTI